VLAFTVGDVENAPADLTVTATSSNTTLVPNANLALGGGGASRTVSIAPAANQSGTTTITLIVNDGTTTSTDTFLLTVNQVNDSPTISNLPDRTIDEDGTTGPLAVIVGDVENAPGDLVLSATSSNTALVPHANITPGGSGANRTVTIVPLANQSGTTTITLTVSDGSATSTDTFVLTVNPIPDAPTISNVADQTINEDGTTGSLAFTVADPDGGNLTVTATSSDTLLVPNGNITLGGSGNNRTVAIAPALNRFGTATITLTVSDGQNLATDTFVLTVNPVNDLPMISDVTNQVINEDATTGPIAFTVGDVETPSASITVSATSSNGGLVPNGNLTFGGNGFNRTITVVPLPNQSGVTTITLTAHDGTESSTRTFLVTVNAVNDPPTITAISDQVIPQGSSSPTIPFTIGDVESPAGVLLLTATSSDQSIIPDANIVLGGSGANRTVTVTPLPTETGGPVTVTIVVSDGSAAAMEPFSVSVVDAEVPTVVSTARNDGDGRLDRLTSLAFTFSEDISGSLNPGDLALVHTASGTPVNLAGAGVSWNGTTMTARWDLSPVAIPIGHYTATLRASGIRDVDGNMLDGNADGIPGDDFQLVAVKTFVGDAELNLDVAFGDFVIMANNFGRPGAWQDGNFTGDAVVDFNDFVALADNFGMKLEMSGSATAAAFAAGEDPAAGESTADSDWWWGGDEDELAL
jgi:hypothetical protein